MPFEELKEGRGRGKGLPPGVSKRKILLYLSLSFPKAISQIDIRDILFEQHDIKSMDTVKEHLNDLKQKDWIEKESRSGKSPLWMVDPERKHFQEISKKFLQSEDRFDFIESDYCQKALTDEYIDAKLDNLRDDIQAFFHRIKEETEGSPVELVRLIEKTGIPKNLFRNSPLALKFLVSREEAEKELKSLLPTLVKLAKEWTKIEETLESFEPKIEEGQDENDSSE